MAVKGNVVKWEGCLYVVAEISTTRAVLLPIDFPNSSAHPSLTWPSKKRGVRSIKVVASTVSSFMQNCFKKAMQEVTLELAKSKPRRSIMEISDNE
jgi:hypothetical protein